jgi:hypothetical protein
MRLDLRRVIIVVAQRVVDLGHGQMRDGVQDSLYRSIVPVVADHMTHGNIGAAYVRLNPGRSVTSDNVRMLSLDFSRHYLPSQTAQFDGHDNTTASLRPLVFF